MTAKSTPVRTGTRGRGQGLPVLGRFPLALRILGYTLVTAVGLLYLMPFVIQLVTGFKTDPDAAAHPLGLIPTTPTTAAYQRLFGLGQAGEGVPFLRWLGNSTFIAVVVTAGRVLFDSMAGYALARLRFPGRTLLFGFVLAVMAVPGVALLIPRFLVLNTLGLFDTYTGMILPIMVDAAGIFIMKQFFEAIPREVEEAARVDGAGVFRIFWSIVLPMARPALLTLTILSFQGSERVHALPGRDPVQSVRDPHHRSGPAGLRRPRRRHPVPAEAGGGAAVHPPGRRPVLLLPALLRAGRERRGGQGVAGGGTGGTVCTVRT